MFEWFHVIVYLLIRRKPAIREDNYRWFEVEKQSVDNIEAVKSECSADGNQNYES